MAKPYKEPTCSRDAAAGARAVCLEEGRALQRIEARRDGTSAAACAAACGGVRVLSQPAACDALQLRRARVARQEALVARQQAVLLRCVRLQRCADPQAHDVRRARHLPCCKFQVFRPCCKIPGGLTTFTLLRLHFTFILTLLRF